MTFKSTAVRGKCWKGARWSKSIWKILVRYYGPNTLITVKTVTKELKTHQWERWRETEEKPCLPGSLCPCGVPRSVTAEWWQLAVAKGLGHLLPSPPSALHPLVGSPSLCAALCHQAPAVPWEALLHTHPWNLLMPFGSVRSWASVSVLPYKWTLQII